MLPPVIPLAALLLGLLLDWLIPSYFLRVFLTFGERLFLGGILVIAGLALMLGGGHYFSVAKTNIPPYKPALYLARRALRLIRNPMYVGFGFIPAGLGITFASDWTLMLMIPAAIVLHRGVVMREERYLEAKFGDPYRQYMMRVPRYGWPPRL